MLEAGRIFLGAGLASAAAGLALGGGVSASAVPHTTTATLVATVAGANHPLDAVPDRGGPDDLLHDRRPQRSDDRAGRGHGRPGPDRPQRRAARRPGRARGPSDGRRLFVADGGVDLVVGARRPRRRHSLAGSGGTAPRGLEVQSQRIVFTGRDAATGRPGVFALPTAGATRPTVLAEGAPLVAPQGVAVSRTERSTSPTAGRARRSPGGSCGSPGGTSPGSPGSSAWVTRPGSRSRATSRACSCRRSIRAGARRRCCASGRGPWPRARSTR